MRISDFDKDQQKDKVEITKQQQSEIQGDFLKALVIVWLLYRLILANTR